MTDGSPRFFERVPPSVLWSQDGFIATADEIVSDQKLSLTLEVANDDILLFAQNFQDVRIEAADIPVIEKFRHQIESGFTRNSIIRLQRLQVSLFGAFGYPLKQGSLFRRSESALVAQLLCMGRKADSLFRNPEF